MKSLSKIHWADEVRRARFCHCVLLLCLLAAQGCSTAEKPVVIDYRQELVTPHYRITLIDHREEFVVSGAAATYIEVNKATGKSITLQGEDAHTLTPDGAPGRFLGYQFKNGQTVYFVSEDGELEVTRGSQVLVKEKGEWKK